MSDELRAEVQEVGGHSLEAAARFAIAVLLGQLSSQGRDWDPKLIWAACKYLKRNLPEGQ